MISTTQVKSFDKPDETRPFKGKGRAEVLNLAGKTVIRGIFLPGWKWSKNVKPIVGTDLCMTAHFGYVELGRMRLIAQGTEIEIGPGDLVSIAPGHDAEVIGSEACIFIDFGDVDSYAKAGTAR